MPRLKIYLASALFLLTLLTIYTTVWAVKTYDKHVDGQTPYACDIAESEIVECDVTFGWCEFRVAGVVRLQNGAEYPFESLQKLPEQRAAEIVRLRYPKGATATCTGEMTVNLEGVKPWIDFRLADRVERNTTVILRALLVGVPFMITLIATAFAYDIDRKLIAASGINAMILKIIRGNRPMPRQSE